jgi:hypothetical protein
MPNPSCPKTSPPATWAAEEKDPANSAKNCNAATLPGTALKDLEAAAGACDKLDCFEAPITGVAEGPAALDSGERPPPGLWVPEPALATRRKLAELEFRRAAALDETLKQASGDKLGKPGDRTGSAPKDEDIASPDGDTAHMSPPGRPKGEHRRAQHEGAPVRAIDQDVATLGSGGASSTPTPTPSPGCRGRWPTASQPRPRRSASSSTSRKAKPPACGLPATR